MTRDEAVAEVKLALAFRRDLDTTIQTQLRTAQAEFEKLPLLPWFLETENTQVSTIAPVTNLDQSITYEERVALPTDFLREKEDSYLEILTSPVGLPQAWVPLRKFDRAHTHDARISFNDIPSAQGGSNTLQQIVQDYGFQRPGQPRAYSMSKDYFRLAPFPDKVYNLRLIYFGKDAVLSSNIENKWLKNFPYLLIGRALWRIASGGTRDPQAAALGQQMQSDAYKAMIAETESREHTNRRYQMGGDQ